MELVVYSTSQAFERFLDEHLDMPFEFWSQLIPPSGNSETVHLLHISGNELACLEWLLKHVSGKSLAVAVCADVPDIREMLECVRLGAKSYCNSHMAAINYRQMLGLLKQGQSWFPPRLLDHAFSLAQQAAKETPNLDSLKVLTNREKEIALAVADGKSNRQIASILEISEPTVKSHLTSIFKKLDLKGRVGLVLYLKQAS